MIKLKMLIENSFNFIFTNKNVKLGNIVTADEIYEYILNIHRNKSDFYDGDIIDRIYNYPYYKISNIDIKNIDLDSYYTDEDLIKRYIQLYNKYHEYPLAVLTSEYDIIDGNHRLNALNAINIKNILAFVGKFEKK